MTTDYTDFAHVGPGTLAGRYLRRFWHPICHVGDLLPGRAQPLRIMSEDFTLYRGDSGAAHLVDARPGLSGLSRREALRHLGPLS